MRTIDQRISLRQKPSRCIVPGQVFEKFITKSKSGECDNLLPNENVSFVGGVDDEWLTAEEAAGYLKVSLGSLRNDTSNGKIPFYKFGNRVRYSRVELSSLLLYSKRGPSSNGY